MTIESADPDPLAIDLNALLQDNTELPKWTKRSHSLSVESKSETPQEQANRIRRENILAYADIIRELTLHAAGLIGIILIAIYCLNVVTSAGFSQEEKKWAMSVITAIVSGVIGFLVGKRQ